MLDWFLETLFPARPAGFPVTDMGEAWTDPHAADGFGLVGIGGDLRLERLVTAYRQGVFPMYEEGEPICWWSPDPRAIFELDGLHVSRRLRRTIRNCGLHATFNRDFTGVMRACADRHEGTWITSEMIDAYTQLHRAGFAHSVEVWHRRQLVGGVYGVAVGGMFAGESMFHRVNDASKIALVALFDRLREREFEFFDTQILNDHTASLGAIEIPRDEYLARLESCVDRPIRFSD